MCISRPDMCIDNTDTFILSFNTSEGAVTMHAKIHNISYISHILKNVSIINDNYDNSNGSNNDKFTINDNSADYNNNYNNEVINSSRIISTTVVPFTNDLSKRSHSNDHINYEDFASRLKAFLVKNEADMHSSLIISNDRLMRIFKYDGFAVECVYNPTYNLQIDKYDYSIDCFSRETLLLSSDDEIERTAPNNLFDTVPGSSSSFS